MCYTAVMFGRLFSRQPHSQKAAKAPTANELWRNAPVTGDVYDDECFAIFPVLDDDVLTALENIEIDLEEYSDDG